MAEFLRKKFSDLLRVFTGNPQSEDLYKPACTKPGCFLCRRKTECCQQALQLFKSNYGHIQSDALSRIEKALINPASEYIFYIKDLKRQSIWTREDLPPHLQDIVSLLESGEYGQQLREDYEKMKRTNFTANNTENSWKTCSFLNQGHWMSSIVDQSRSGKLVRSLRGIMDGNVFGNAFYSVLKVWCFYYCAIVIHFLKSRAPLVKSRCHTSM